MRLSSLATIAKAVEACTRCPLYKTANRGVPGEGDAKARLVCVGEAPGANEDETGKPFVGQAGQLLTKIIEAIGLRREDVYIANVIKCRPPGNRDPQPDASWALETPVPSGPRQPGPPLQPQPLQLQPGAAAAAGNCTIA